MIPGVVLCFITRGHTMDVTFQLRPWWQERAVWVWRSFNIRLGNSTFWSGSEHYLFQKKTKTNVTGSWWERGEGWIVGDKVEGKVCGSTQAWLAILPHFHSQHTFSISETTVAQHLFSAQTFNTSTFSTALLACFFGKVDVITKEIVCSHHQTYQFTWISNYTAYFHSCDKSS